MEIQHAPATNSAGSSRKTTADNPAPRKAPKRLNPRNEAVAFRVWQDCQTHGWYRTIHDIADSIDEPVNRLVQILQLKRWTGRIRRIQIENIDVPLKTVRVDEALGGICGDRMPTFNE
jgi:neutral trehalase